MNRLFRDFVEHRVVQCGPSPTCCSTVGQLDDLMPLYFLILVRKANLVHCKYSFVTENTNIPGGEAKEALLSLN